MVRDVVAYGTVRHEFLNICSIKIQYIAGRTLSTDCRDVRGVHPANTALVVLTAVALVGTAVTAGATGGAETQRPAVQPQEERLENGTALQPGVAGKFVSGRAEEVNMVYPGNFIFSVKNHEPGASSGFTLYAAGFQHDQRLHWNILYQPDFDWSSCGAGNAAAYGLDRGNDDSGTGTDVSLLSAAKTLQFRDGGINTAYYKENALAGEPITVNVEDQVIASLNDCQQNPSEPGWYRAFARSNGSTQMDTQTDFAVATTDYTYICEGCDSRQDAIEKLGPPPEACPEPEVMPTDSTGLTSKEWTCRSDDGTYYTTGESPGGSGSPSTATPGEETTPTATASGGGGASTPTATPGDGGGSVSTPTATAATTPTATATASSIPASEETATATPTPTPATAAGSGGDGSTAAGGSGSGDAATTSADGGGGQAQSGEVAGGDTPVTPTIGSGPGLGALATLGALAALALLLARRD